MRLNYLLLIPVFLVFAFVSFVPLRTSGQGASAPSLITQPVDQSKLTTLSGNTHPLARAQYDQGAAPASLALDHMTLVLKRSAQQQAALDTLLAQQQDRSSPNFHKWLTPEQFGQQFGPSAQDIQTVTSWLQSQGFQSPKVSNGRTLIDFSGTAGQVQQAFHTAIHRYVMSDGSEHWANAGDPQIPTELTPVVAGVSSLNNFRPKPRSHSLGVVRRNNATGKFARVNPQFTFPGVSLGDCNGASGSNNCYAVGPADFDIIYNVPSTATGAGQTIAIGTDSDINPNDVTNFRTFFGLSPVNDYVDVYTTGYSASNPGNLGVNSDESEAILDVEWAGAVAPAATIDLVVSGSTNTTFGVDTSAEWVIDGNIHPIPSVLGYSYGNCELYNGTALNAMYSSMWSQAAAEGITVAVAAGDSGSAGCDDPDINSPAEFGLQVTGQASTPYDVAVGGTDFNDFTNPTTYWNSTDTGTGQSSAKGYVPEIAYNDSCTNSIIYTYLDFANGELDCNSGVASADGLLEPAGGSGGVSNCTTNSTTATSSTLVVSSCSGGYAKPSWQTGPGVPNDGKRDLPDVSFFAGDGTIQNYYIICEADAGAPCTLGVTSDFLGEGGTSVSTEAFAGVMALVNQKFGGAQGDPNPTFYALAGEQSASSCNATSSPASSCVFNDVTVGTNAMPCIKGSPNCTVSFSADTVGVLSGYSAGTGYDLVTGLGSLNVGNLLSKYGPNFYLYSSSPAVSISSPGASGTFSVTATSVNGFAGTVTLGCSGLPTGATCSFSPASIALTSGSSSASTVTVNTTTASRIIPANRPIHPGGWTRTEQLTLLLVLCAGVLLIARRETDRRWSTVAAVAVLAILLGSAACGGGSSSSTSSGGSSGTTGTTGTTTATVTGTSTSGVVFSMNVAVTIQ